VSSDARARATKRKRDYHERECQIVVIDLYGKPRKYLNARQGAHVFGAEKERERKREREREREKEGRGDGQLQRTVEIEKSTA